MQTNNRLREALAKILGVADHVQTRFAIPELANREISELKQIAEDAVAEPIRNCEVGTDNEQIRRWKEFCDHYEVDRSPESFARWAQGPYFEEGGAK